MTNKSEALRESRRRLIVAIYTRLTGNPEPRYGDEPLACAPECLSNKRTMELFNSWKRTHGGDQIITAISLEYSKLREEYEKGDGDE